MRFIVLACGLALALAGCIHVHEKPQPNTTVVVPPNSSTTTVVCPNNASSC